MDGPTGNGSAAGITLVTGPAGSGKTGAVLDRFASRLEREPVLVVPTAADVARYEDELLFRQPVALGGRVVTFGGLFELVADGAGLVTPPLLTPAQQHALLAATTAEAKLEALAQPARRPGFVDALQRLVEDLQAALVEPEALRERLARTGGSRARTRHLGEVADLFDAYLRRRDRLGRSDRGTAASAALAALRARPAAWGARPVMVHGFDDLTPVQLALVRVLAERAEVVVSVVHEPGRACLAARGRLVDRVCAVAEGLAPAADTPHAQLELGLDATDPAPTAHAPRRVDLQPRGGSGLLSHLERGFLADDPERHAPDGALELVEAPGALAELERVGAAIVRLLRAGVEPEGIALIARDPERVAGTAEEVLGRLGVPLAIEATRPVAETAVGRGLLALLRLCFTTRSASDVVGFLRCPGRAPAGRVDRLERAIRVEGIDGAQEALERWERGGARAPWEPAALEAAAAHGSPAVLAVAARVVRELAERPHRRTAPLLDPGERGEQLAAEAIASALDELAEIAAVDPTLAPAPERLVETLERLRVRRSRAGAAGRVELMSPYRARARQFPYVFVLGLEDGRFPRGGHEDPFLTEDERRRAGLPEAADQREEERYLFYVALTRATRRLQLSYRTCDEDGIAVTRSFFVDELLDLLAPGAEAAVKRSWSPAEALLDPAEAPTERELARSLAARGMRAAPVELRASDPLAARLGSALGRAGERAGRLPGSIAVDAVRAELAARTRIGASSLEQNAECSFRHFIEHELRPDELAPRSEALTRGSLTHAVLERVYSEHGERPTPATVERLAERARRLLLEEAEGTSLDPARPEGRAALRRIESDIARYLRHDAEQGGGALVGVEAGFGDRDGDERPALALAGFELHGKIDRIDRVGEGQALIRDYKTGSSVPSRKEMAEQLKLQLPLYMLAVRRLWGLDPIGGVYHPLGKQHEAKPRGLLRGPAADFPVEERFTATDYTRDADEFEAALAAAQAEAERLGGRIRDGHLARDPLGGSCPAYCDFHPICRRERGEKNPEEVERRLDEDADG